MREIGSEFWLEDIEEKTFELKPPLWLNVETDNKFLLSGRTAIDYVLRDIKSNNVINNVYFPSYCCQSMIQPFIDHDINVVFYDVKYEGQLNFNINTAQECDVFFAMNYFGFSKGRMDKYIEIFKQRNIIVIEDATHSLLSDNPYNANSDYIVASLRKWLPIISGGLAIKTKDAFNINFKNKTLQKMIKERKQAMKEKGMYIFDKNSINKKGFLKKYKNANEMLNKDYSLYNIDDYSYEIIQNLNLDLIISKRKKNAKFLYEKLTKINKYNLIFPEIEYEDCPIFVPIVFNDISERNNLREHLTKNNIYCPVHWPKPDKLDCVSSKSIYSKELSLVVDQRYDKSDMEYLVRRIEKFYD